MEFSYSNVRNELYIYNKNGDLAFSITELGLGFEKFSTKEKEEYINDQYGDVIEEMIRH